MALRIQPARVAMPSWLGGARRLAARRPGPVLHLDGTCDAVYPGASDDRDGRCLLPGGHAGAHVYRGRGPARKPTSARAYAVQRDEKKRVARVALARQRRERKAQLF
jgi:hypothetical protein